MAITITMPQLGETVTEGTILSWNKRPGDTVEVDEVLLEISTDKVDTEVPSPAAGTVLEILVAEGQTVAVGTALAVIGEPGEVAFPAPGEQPASPAPAPAAEVAAPAPVSAAEVAAPTPAAEGGPTAPAGSGVLSPVVRKLAAEYSIDLSRVPGTGRDGRITRKDVLAFIEAGGAAVAEPAAAVTVPAPASAPTPSPEVVAPAPAPTVAPVSVPSAPPAATPLAPGDEVIELDRMRTRIATNLIRAKQTAAHVWTSVEVDFEGVERVRSRHKEAFKESEGFSLTYLPFIARATVDALAAFPTVNSSFFLEEGRQVLHRQVHMGIAVDLDQHGLIVTTLRGADGLRLKGLAREIRRLAEKARSGKLEPDDVVGSTFTITNPGPFGSFLSAPIINVPNTGILSTDTVTKRPTVVTNPDGTDAITIHHIGYLGLTWDHRAFDGSTAVLFLQRIKESLETRDWEQELQ